MAETRKCWNNRFATLVLYSYRILHSLTHLQKKSLYLNKAEFLTLYSNKGSFYTGRDLWITIQSVPIRCFIHKQ